MKNGVTRRNIPEDAILYLILSFEIVYDNMPAKYCNIRYGKQSYRKMVVLRMFLLHLGLIVYQGTQTSRMQFDTLVVSARITATVLDNIHRPVFYIKLDISETGLCLRLQVE
jgi:hypothetical protein